MLQMKKSPMQSGRRDVFTVESDFDGYVTGDEWTGGGDTGAVAVEADTANGIVDLQTTALDNDETWLHTTQEVFLFDDFAKKPLCFEALLYYDEVTADTCNLFVGFMNALATTPFQDDGAGPKANFYGFGIYRRGSTAGIAAGTLTALDAAVWNTIVSVGAAQNLQRLDLTDVPNNLAGEKVNAEDETLYRFRAECKPVCLKTAAIVNMDFDFWIDDIHVAHENIDMTLAGFTEMHFGVAIHAGDGEILHAYVDYLSGSQIRILTP